MPYFVPVLSLFCIHGKDPDEASAALLSLLLHSHDTSSFVAVHPHRGGLCEGIVRLSLPSGYVLMALANES